MIDLDEDMMTDQQYSYDGRPGCVLRHRTRATGTTIAVYRADQAGMDTSTGDWVAVCEDHRTQHSFSNLRHARAHYATAPWCPGCHPDGAPGVHPPPAHKAPNHKVAPYVRIMAGGLLFLNMDDYRELGSPAYVRLTWQPKNQQLVITAATAASAQEEDVYKIRPDRRADGTNRLSGSVRAIRALRTAGLTPGRYQPEVKDRRIIIKPSAKVTTRDDQADDHDEAAEEPDDQAQL